MILNARSGGARGRSGAPGRRRGPRTAAAAATQAPDTTDESAAEPPASTAVGSDTRVAAAAPAAAAARRGARQKRPIAAANIGAGAARPKRAKGAAPTAAAAAPLPAAAPRGAVAPSAGEARKALHPRLRPRTARRPPPLCGGGRRALCVRGRRRHLLFRFRSSRVYPPNGAYSILLARYAHGRGPRALASRVHPPRSRATTRVGVSSCGCGHSGAHTHTSQHSSTEGTLDTPPLAPAQPRRAPMVPGAPPPCRRRRRFHSHSLQPP